MSCGCKSDPCVCQPQCPPPGPCTRCDRYVRGTPNVWVEHGANPGDENTDGVCLLDTMRDDQVIYVLEHDEKARKDLLAVTSDPHLIELANTVPRLPTFEESDGEQHNINRPNDAGSNPFYAVFRGQPPFAQ